MSTLSVAVAVGSSGTAYAQNVLEEVVVTARKRQESLQETPIAISAMSGEELAQTGMRDVADLRAVVPNIDVYTGNGTTGSGNIFIRGVGARNTGVNYDSGVGIYLDGVYISRPDGAVLDNVDIASLEVLRGPQGTLFGKNSTGGAILYSTSKPTHQVEGKVDVRVGNYDRRDAKLTFNLPIVEDLLLSRVSVYSTKRDGYIENVPDGTKLSDEDRQGAQAHFLVLPTDNLIIDINTFYTKTDQAARGQKCQVVQGIPGSGWQSAAQDGLILGATGRTIAQNCQANQDLSIDKVRNDLTENRYFSENYTGAVTVDWDINSHMSLKSITAYRTTRAGEANDLDGMGIPLLHRTNFATGGELRTTDQWSQEFQISGNLFDETVDYVAGVYGFKEESDAGAGVSPSGPFFFGNIFGFPAAFYNNTRTELISDNWAYAAFSQVDWKFAEDWSLTLGLRFTKERRELRRILDNIDTSRMTSNGIPVIVAAPGVYLFPGGAASFNPDHGFVHIVSPSGSITDINDQTQSTGKTKFSPMGSIQYTLSDVGPIETGSAYFTIASGFLSGGIAEALDPFTQELPTYKPEEVISYELGFKMDALERRLRLNAAAFYLDYKDRQLTSVVIDPQTGRVAGIPINAKKSSITGFELESQFIPIPNLELTVNYTYNDGEIEEFDDTRIVTPGSLPGANCRQVVSSVTVDTCAVDRSDEDLPRLPTQIYFVAVQYAFNTPIGSITPRLQWSKRLDVENCFDRSSCLSGVYEGDQEDLSARLTWSSPDKQWMVAAFATNITDERYIIGGTPLVDVTQTAGIVYNEPSMYGAELHYSW